MSIRKYHTSIHCIDPMFPYSPAPQLQIFMLRRENQPELKLSSQLNLSST